MKAKFDDNILAETKHLIGEISNKQAEAEVQDRLRHCKRAMVVYLAGAPAVGLTRDNALQALVDSMEQGIRAHYQSHRGRWSDEEWTEAFVEARFYHYLAKEFGGSDES